MPTAGHPSNLGYYKLFLIIPHVVPYKPDNFLNLYSRSLPHCQKVHTRVGKNIVHNFGSTCTINLYIALKFENSFNFCSKGRCLSPLNPERLQTKPLAICASHQPSTSSSPIHLSTKVLLNSFLFYQMAEDLSMLISKLVVVA